MSTEQAARDHEEEADRQREAEAEIEKQKMANEAVKKGGKAGAGGGKGGKGGKKSRSPSPKKGKGATAKDVMSPEPTPQRGYSECSFYLVCYSCSIPWWGDTSVS